MSWAVRALWLFLVSCSGHRRDGPASEHLIFNELCAFKEDPGPCKALKDRFFFNVETGRCQDFQYGGCGGNANNFQTLQACEETCRVSVDKNPCHLPSIQGPCRGLLKRFFYDSDTTQCKDFYYGGCHGNANNFRSLQACQARCHNTEKLISAPEVHTLPPPKAELLHAPPVHEGAVSSKRVQQLKPQANADSRSVQCSSPVDTGTCSGSIRRFYFNPDTRRCHVFIFSGCGGNENNFTHRRHCMKKCRDGGMKMIRIRKKNLENIVTASV